MRRPSLYGLGIVVPALDLLTQLLLVVLGFALVFSPHALDARARRSARTRPGTRSRSRCRSRCSRSPASRRSRTSPRRRGARASTCRARSSAAIATVVTIYVAIAVVALSAFPGPEHRARHALDPRAAARRRRQHPAPSCRAGSATSLRFYVGVTGALILLAAVTTSISGFSRLAYSLGEHGQLPRSFGRLQPPGARLAARDRLGRASISSAIVIATSFFRHDVAVPREPLLVRRAARVHGGAARGDQAADRRARPAASLPRAAQRPHPRRARSRCRRSSARSLTFAIWIARARDAPRRALRRPGLARDRARRLRRRAPLARRGADGARDAPRRAAGRDGAAVPAGSSCR